VRSEVVVRVKSGAGEVVGHDAEAATSRFFWDCREGTGTTSSLIGTSDVTIYELIKHASKSYSDLLKIHGFQHGRNSFKI
jgi:hypothetical protein